MFKICFSLFLLVLSTQTLFSRNFVSPPDTVSSIVDKTTALLMIEEGKTQFNEGKVRDALVKFREAAVKDPYTWRAPYWVSQCHYAMNNYGLALKYASEAVTLDDDEIIKSTN